MQIMTRSGHAVSGRLTGGHRVRALPAFGRRTADAGQADVRGRATTPSTFRTSRVTHDLELRLGLRRQCLARQEVLRAADRLGRSGATRAGWPSTCSSSNSPRRRARRTTSRPRSRPRAARPTWRCSSPHYPAGRPRPSVTTSPGCVSAPTAGSTRSTRRPGSSVSRPEPASAPTPTRSPPSTEATRSSPTPLSPTTVMCGGRA